METDFDVLHSTFGDIVEVRRHWLKLVRMVLGVSMRGGEQMGQVAVELMGRVGRFVGDTLRISWKGAGSMSVRLDDIQSDSGAGILQSCEPIQAIKFR